MPRRNKDKVRVGGDPQEFSTDRLPTVQAIIRHIYHMAFVLDIAFSLVNRLVVIVADDLRDLWQTLLPDLPLINSRLDHLRIIRIPEFVYIIPLSQWHCAQLCGSKNLSLRYRAI